MDTRLKNQLAEAAMEYALESFDPDHDPDAHAVKKQNIIGFAGLEPALEAIEEAFQSLKMVGLSQPVPSIKWLTGFVILDPRLRQPITASVT